MRIPRFRSVAGLFATGSILFALPGLAQNIVVNGSFEQPAIAADSFQIFSPSIPGWTDTSGCGIEIQSGVAGAPSNGAQLVELDSNCSSTIVQTLSTQPGLSYVLRFDFSARPGVTDNHVQVKWGGAVVADLTANGSSLSNTQWTTHLVPVTATGASTTLSFADLSVSDALGTDIDNVEVDPAVTIPSLSTWGLIALAILLTLVAGFTLSRQA
jgi:Protein of unknown function (DUF642)